MLKKMILATSSKEDGYAIGGNNKLLWDIPEDLAYFQRVTTGGVVLMGNNTFKSLPFKGKGLPKRKNVVVSRNTHGGGLGLNTRIVSWVKDLDWFIEEGLPFYEKYGREVSVIGGASVYEQMLPYVQEIHHTEVSGSYPDADSHFDMSFLDKGGWKLYSKEVLCEQAKVNVWKRVNI